MDKEEIGPQVCSFKKACMMCIKVIAKDRPTLCFKSKCEHYTPCPQCNNNRRLNDHGICAICEKANEEPEEVESFYVEAVKQDTPKLDISNKKDLVDSPKNRTVTFPGKAHPDYNEQEREYYDTNWMQYKDYFRDPSAYPLIHKLLMLEIELNTLSNTIVFYRNKEGLEDKVSKMEDREKRLLESIKIIRNQLPEKEAQELTDDEKSIAMICDRFTKFRKTRYQGGVSRILSPQAIALAPVLQFKVNPHDLIRRLGYTAKDIDSVMDILIKLSELPRDPIELVEFFGMPVKEKVAPNEYDTEPNGPEVMEDEAKSGIADDDLEFMLDSEPEHNPQDTTEGEGL